MASLENNYSVGIADSFPNICGLAGVGGAGIVRGATLTVAEINVLLKGWNIRVSNDSNSSNVESENSEAQASKPGRDGSWGAAARDWAEAQEGTMQPIFEAVLERVSVGPGMKVLDVGCGTGLLCKLALDRGAEAFGMDASPTQLEVARERVPGAEFKQAEMEELPYADGEFDLITCSNALQYSLDAKGTLAEMKRITRPGGTVAIITGTRTREAGAGSGMGAFYSSLTELRAATSGPTTGAPRVIFSDPDAVARFMEEVGLEPYDEEEVQCDWDYPNLDTALRGGLSFAPGVRIIRHAGKEKVHAMVTETLEPYKTESGGYHIPSKSRYILGRA